LIANHATAPSSPEIGDGSERIAEALVGLLEGQVDAAQIAGVIARTWVDIDGALSPVLGKRGVAALYKRSLHLSGSAHVWLSDIQVGPNTAIDFESLQKAFTGQSNSEAASAAAAMLRAFCDLLVSLVGTSLTGRLLSPVLTHFQVGHTPKAL
jgi:hypothetical protein